MSSISSEKSLFSPEEFNEYVQLMKLNEEEEKNCFLYAYELLEYW